MKMHNAPRIDPFSFALCGMAVVAPYVPPHVVASDRIRQKPQGGAPDREAGDDRPDSSDWRDLGEVGC